MPFAGGIDGWRLVDRGEAAASVDEGRDELGKAARGQQGMIELSRDCDKYQGNHGGEYLQAHGVLIEGDELTDAEVLLDPAEQELDLPARLVGGGKLSGAAGLIIGEDVEDLAGVGLDGDSAQEDWQLGIAFAGECHLAVGLDGEAVTPGVCERTQAHGLPAHVDLGPGDEERPRLVDGSPPAEMAVGLVEHVNDARLDRQWAGEGDIIDIGRGDLERQRTGAGEIVQDVQLEPVNAAIGGGAIEQPAERYRGRIDECRMALPSLRALRPRPLESAVNSCAKIAAGRRALASARVDLATRPQPR